MNILIESGCTKNAYKKTKSILSRYLSRKNSHSWFGRLTYNGMEDLRSELTSSARRNTSIVCYSVEKNELNIIWKVGNKTIFSDDGSYISKKGKGASNIPDWIRTASLLASAGGMFHDIGKITIPFQSKLRIKDYKGDYIRHEIISLLFISILCRENHTITKDYIVEHWVSIWNEISSVAKRADGNVFFETLFPMFEKESEKSVYYMIGTHHKLFGIGGLKGSHIYDQKSDVIYAPYPNPQPSLDNIFKKETLTRIARIIESVKSLDYSDQDFSRAMSTYSRASLIAADHYVSSRSYCDNNKPMSNEDFAANTHTCKASDIGHLNQPLDYHLREVSMAAGKMAIDFHNLSSDLNGIIAPEWKPCSERFKWQDKAVSAISSAREEFSDRPFLIYLNSSTGSGKTLTGLKLGFAASVDKSNVRLTSAFNLRSLTVQTGAEYKNAGMNPSVIIGDKVSMAVGLQQASNAKKEADSLNHNNETYSESVDKDDSTLLNDANVISSGSFKLPAWTEKITNGKSSNKAILGSPLLVSTIDYIAHAGNPNDQRKHIMAMLRCMHSDLIIDEIDSFNTKSITAVCRVVEISAMFGRNVIISSATVSTVIMDEIFIAFKHGQDMFDALNNNKKQKVLYAIVNDYMSPIVELGDLIDHSYSSKMIEVIKNKNAYRISEVFDIKDSVFSACKSIFDKSIEMHNRYKNKGISVGAIRIFRAKKGFVLVDQLNRLARDYNTENNNIVFHIGHYHANLSSGQRIYIESELERLLHRQFGVNEFPQNLLKPSNLGGKIHLEDDGKEHIFILVATPVIDVGRDFDFDWGIIEPTSVRAVVQFSGRINRHRLINVTSPNIAIMNDIYSAMSLDSYRVTGWENNPLTSKREAYENVLDFYHVDHGDVDEDMIMEMHDKTVDATWCLPIFDKQQKHQYKFLFQAIDVKGQKDILTNKTRVSTEYSKTYLTNKKIWCSKSFSNDLYKKNPLRESCQAGLHLRVREERITECVKANFNVVEYNLDKTQWKYLSGDYGTEWLTYNQAIKNSLIKEFGIDEDDIINVILRYAKSTSNILFHDSYGAIYKS